MINNSRKINKLVFTGYKNVDFKEILKEPPYSVMINPESFKRSMNILCDQKQEKVDDSLSGDFINRRPETYSFEFTVDGTGVVDGIKEPVCMNIERFLTVVYQYHSDLHRPSFVQIDYCGLIMNCVLKSLDINYTLFNPDSTPLRAKISCSFSAVMRPSMSAINKYKCIKQSEIEMALIKGRKEGEAIGKRKKSINVALKAIEMSLSIKDASKLSDLTIKEIEELIKKSTN